MARPFATRTVLAKCLAEKVGTGRLTEETRRPDRPAESPRRMPCRSFHSSWPASGSPGHSGELEGPKEGPSIPGA